MLVRASRAPNLAIAVTGVPKRFQPSRSVPSAIWRAVICFVGTGDIHGHWPDVIW
jgi:hypothetical protein